MVVASLTWELSLPGCSSLKQKRSVVRSLRDRLRGKFNVSVAEVGSNDKWQIGELGIATVGNEAQFVNSVMTKVEDFLETFPSIRVIEADLEIL